MTVCLGALCTETGESTPRCVVMGSDRMITMGGFIEFEHETPKGTAISRDAIALIAGDAWRGSRLVQDVKARLPAQGASMPQIAEIMAQRYAELRNEQVQVEIFTPRGITMHQYYAGLQSQMLPQIAAAIDQKMMELNYKVECLLGGVDDTGAHLYLIYNPGGAYIDVRQTGFAAVGSGAIHALQSLIGFHQTSARSVAETVFDVYASKQRAEAAPGVGQDTDIWIIRDSGVQHLEAPVLAELESLYQKYQRPIGKDLQEKIAGLALGGKQNADAHTG